jgi:ketosteroid isomerase-like protein
LVRAVRGFLAAAGVSQRRIRADARFAVRWQLTATYEGRPFEQSIMAIYRFENGRIAEDWGISNQALCHEAGRGI